MTITRARRMKTEAWEYRLLMALGTLYFLFIVAAMRVVPRQWRPDCLGGRSGGSVIDDARTAASITVGYAFMH